MEGVTLSQISMVLAFVVGLIGSVEFISIRLKNWFKKALNDELKPIMDEVKNIREDMDERTLSRCKGDLVSLMSRIQTGYVPTHEEKWLLYETKEKYNSLGGDSYVDDMFNNLKKEGKI